ncbi:MAG: hypothetical protein HOB40_02160 [Candidatus Marinimicrobia bacterium]|jgi:hypothetical protein|nr:hypothetical protein [Candidatus Neomarinimicrobiota bacterium]MBT3501676.1 hypothetical protein [Candidatus Neomarinimicrobiota bacterium]MBT3839854.1 hypothetical protein [Candidatus Neomarinimicrobiota bacterium]MBT3998442.1 hypothetical protein [Candidatus Neomarinimicrobiota bacterium]MBT4282238.1 hypothetical protein [Candidatus Neomarinimicrobiota bacterium]
MKKTLFIYFGFILTVFSQDDLLDLIEDTDFSPIPVTATFKSTRIVNSQSIELVSPDVLEFMIQHRFGSMKNGLYDLFGMDGAAIRFDLQYGINKHISVGAGRSSLKKNYDLFSKIKMMNQTNLFPISIAFFWKVEIETLKRNNDVFDKMVNRLSYDSQILIARKFNHRLSAQIMPTLIHHNLVKTYEDSHDLISVGIGGRFKVSNRISINADTFFPMGERGESFVQSWGLGFDIQTGGHVFQLMVTNVQGAYESAYIENASGTIDEMNIYLGFNITRAFTL